MADRTIAVEYAVYAPGGFLTWDDERGGVTQTAKLENAATFRTAADAWEIAQRDSVRGCVVRSDGHLMTVAEIAAESKGR